MDSTDNEIDVAGVTKAVGYRGKGVVAVVLV